MGQFLNSTPSPGRKHFRTFLLERNYDYYTTTYLINFFFTKPNSFGDVQFSSDGILIFILTLVSIAFYFFIIYHLLFKTNKNADKLKPDQKFNQEEFSFNILTSLVLTIILIVTGGVILTNQIPNLCKNIFSCFQKRVCKYLLLIKSLV